MSSEIIQKGLSKTKRKRKPPSFKGQYMKGYQKYLHRCHFWKHDPGQPDLQVKPSIASTVHPQRAPSTPTRKASTSPDNFPSPTLQGDHLSAPSTAASSGKPPFQLCVLQANLQALSLMVFIDFFSWKFLKYIHIFHSAARGHPSHVLGYCNNHVIYVKIIGVKLSATSNSSHLAPSLGPRNI